MAQILDMPQLSDTMKIGVLQKWRKNEGDAIKPGEVLAEVETDKAVMDFEAYDPGVLLKRLIADGASVPVGTPIAIIGKAGEDVSKLVAAAAPAPAPKAPAPPAAPVNGKAARPAAPPAPRPAPTASAPASKVLASPLARKLATDLGIDLRTVQGTGPGGRIVERDVKAVAEGGGQAVPAQGSVDWHAAEEAPATAPRASAAAPLPAQLVPERRAEARPSAAAPSDDIVKPLSMMRRTIAARLMEAKT